MDTYRLLDISELDDDSLEQLAVLHHSVMHTLLSDLGLPIVLKYYQVARSDLSVIGACMVIPPNEIIGWTIGSPNPAALNANLRKPLSWFLLQMSRVALMHPLVFKQLVSSVLSSSAEMEVSKDAVELTYIGISPAYQGKGLGRTLINKFIEQSRAKGYHSVVLSVEKQNTIATALYEKSGFRIIKTSTEGRYQRHRMELTLA